MSDARSTAPPYARLWLRALVLALLAFLAGLAAMAWLLGVWPTGARLLGLAPASAPVQRVAMRPPASYSAVPAGEIPQRLAFIEARLDRVDRASRDAVGSSDRAEGLLVAFAARRALDRGVALGYIEGLLRERFVATQRLAVATVITAARRPVTLEQLQQGLGELQPNLVTAAPDDDWWTATRRELNNLVTVRRAGSTSTVPSERLGRARDRLAAGQVDVALAEVLRLPGQERAAAWIDQAGRYVAARRALDTLETAALLDPVSTDPPSPAAAPPLPAAMTPLAAPAPQPVTPQGSPVATVR